MRVKSWRWYLHLCTSKHIVDRQGCSSPWTRTLNEMHWNLVSWDFHIFSFSDFHNVLFTLSAIVKYAEKLVHYFFVCRTSSWSDFVVLHIRCIKRCRRMDEIQLNFNSDGVNHRPISKIYVYICFEPFFASWTNLVVKIALMEKHSIVAR